MLSAILCCHPRSTCPACSLLCRCKAHAVPLVGPDCDVVLVDYLCRNLNSNNLTGTLPESWATGFAFLKLAELHLASNQLSGPLSYAWATTNTSFVELMVW